MNDSLMCSTGDRKDTKTGGEKMEGEAGGAGRVLGAKEGCNLILSIMGSHGRVERRG